jgi:hypothetical protein
MRWGILMVQLKLEMWKVPLLDGVMEIEMMKAPLLGVS